MTWILAYETGNGRKTDAVKKTLSTLLSTEYQEKASTLGYVPLRGDILQKARDAIEKIAI